VAENKKNAAVGTGADAIRTSNAITLEHRHTSDPNIRNHPIRGVI
jgi:hypothetical protein